MTKHEQHSGRPQFIYPRASYEFTESAVRRRRGSVLLAFFFGAIRAALIGLIPVLLVVGALDYLANGWNDFGQELLNHWTLIVLPLALIGVIGGIRGVLRR